MPGIGTIIGWIAGPLVSLVLGWVGKLFGSAQDKLQGMNDQKAADDSATLKSATQGAVIASTVQGESDAEVVRDLGNDFRQ